MRSFGSPRRGWFGRTLGGALIGPLSYVDKSTSCLDVSS